MRPNESHVIALRVSDWAYEERKAEQKYDVRIGICFLICAKMKNDVDWFYECHFEWKSLTESADAVINHRCN